MSSVVTKNGVASNQVAVPAKQLGIEARTTKFWCVGDAKIVEEAGNGHYSITDRYWLNLDGLRRLHAVLGYILQDATADQEGPAGDPFFDAGF
jgi:hypothetical protein